jgi:hypothetical protein
MSGRTFTTTVSINCEIDASVQRAFAGMADRLSAVQRAAIQTAGATDKLSAVIDQQGDQLEAAKKAYTDYILSGEKSKKKAKELAKHIKKLAKELDDNEEQLTDAQKAAEKLAGGLKKTGDAAEDSKDGFTVMRGAASQLVANGITKITQACVDAVRNIYGLAESTREYREDMGKLETAFEAAGRSTDIASETYKNFYAVLGEEDRSVEAVSHLAKFVETEQDMQKWTDICAGVWGTFGDSLPIEGLTEAANETAKVGEVTGVLADALNWAGVNQEDFQTYLDKCTTEQERAAYITEMLNSLYGDAAEKYKENNASIIEARKANSEYTDTVAKMGELIEPITTKVQEGFTLILQKVLDLVSGGDIEAFGDRIDAAFGSFVDDVLPMIMTAMDWIANHTGLLTGIAVAIGVIAAAVGVFNAVLAVQNALMLANPTTWIVLGIVAAIAALIAIIVLCVKHWDDIKAAALSAAEWMANAWDSVANKMLEFGAKIGEIWNGISAWIGTAIETIGQYFPIFGGYLSGWWSSISAAVENVKGIFYGIIDFISNVFAGNWSAAWDNVVSIFGNLFGSLVNIAKAPINGVIGAINAVIGGINGVGFTIPDWVPLVGGKEFSLDIPKIPMFATGGFTNGVSIAGEDPRYPTEAIISFNPAYSDENMSIWTRAGRMLGADTEDFSLGGSGGGSYVDFGGVTFAPNITVSGNADKESIMEAIEAEYPEFIDMLEEYLMQRRVTAYA